MSLIYEVAVYISDELKRNIKSKLVMMKLDLLLCILDLPLKAHSSNAAAHSDTYQRVWMHPGKLVEFFVKCTDEVEIVDVLTCFQNTTIEGSVDMIVSTLQITCLIKTLSVLAHY